MKSATKPVLTFSVVVALAMLACQALSSPGVTNGNETPSPVQVQPTTPPTQTLPETSSAEILYEDNFDDPNSGWLSLRDQDGITDYDQGGYRIKVDKTDWFFWAEAGRTFTDVRIDVDATKLGGPDKNEFGVVCRYVDEHNFYFFTAASDGFYGITKLINDEYEFTGMTELKASEAINLGATANHLQAVCKGNTLHFSVNGTLLAEVQDDSFSSGDIGLIVGSSETPGADILFDNLIVIRP